VEWTVSELAERAGISGRTLRHYHRIGLLEPDRIGSNGYRYYGPAAVARLQRILLLRGTGMGLDSIKRVLASAESPTEEIDALTSHLQQLRSELAAIEGRIRAVEHTITMRREGREPRMDVMLEGFNDRYEGEVVRRWGQDAYDAAHNWWHAKTLDQQRDWKQRSERLLARWADLDRRGFPPASDAAQQHAATHIAWFTEIPGTPTHEGDARRSAAMICGMATMYETHPEFHHAFGTASAARLAAESLRIRTARTAPDEDG